MKLSVIIPTLNEEGHIGSTVSAVLALGDDIEVIVVDGGSTDATVKIASGHGAIVETCKPGRASQMNLGAELSRGEILIFLHADTRLPPATADLIAKALANPRIEGGSFRLKFDNDHPVLRFSGWLSRMKTPFIHYGDSAYFIRRSTFFELGGYRELPILEDLDFFSRLSDLNEIVIIKDPVITSARRFVEKGVLRMQILSVLIIGLYLLKVSPHTLRKLYERCQ